MSPARWVGSLAVARKGLRTRLGFISGHVGDDLKEGPASGLRSFKRVRWEMIP